MAFTSYEELEELLDENGGIITCDMGTLRDAHGVAKLGVNVVANISEALNDMNIGHLPTELPKYQHARVGIYNKSAPVGKIIKAVLNIDEDSVELLRTYSTNQHEYIIKRIRELVCD